MAVLQALLWSAVALVLLATWLGYLPTLPVLFGSLAMLALWTTWRGSDLRWIGIGLVIGCAASNALFYVAPVEFRPGPYSLIEVMVGFFAYIAWLELRFRALLIIIVVNILSVCANIAFAASFHPGPWQIYVFELATNACFVAECLLATGVGVAHGYRTGRFRRQPRLPWQAPKPRAVRQAEP